MSTWRVHVRLSLLPPLAPSFSFLSPVFNPSVFLCVVSLLFFSYAPWTVSGGHPDAKRLYDDLLSHYNKLVRPVANNTDPLTVHIKLKLSQLIDVNLKNQIMTTNLWVEQYWHDYKLSWEPREYGGVEMLHVPSDHIWRPDIVLYNNADGSFEVTLATKAALHYTGKVEWKPPAIYKSSCEINVEYFPFDEQTCIMKFGSWTYSGYQVDLRHRDEVEGTNIIDLGVDLSSFYLSVEWDILEVPAVRNEKYYTCCDEPYVDITFSISMRRKTLFYTVNLIIPCMFISFLTVLVFYLPSDSGEKVTLSIGILLSLTVFFLLLAEIIPPTSMAVPLLGKYLLFTMILVTLSICVTVIVLNVHFRSPTTHTMSPWVRRVFIHILPRLLVMRRPQYPGAKTKVDVQTCNGVDLPESSNSPAAVRSYATSRDCCLHGEGCPSQLVLRRWAQRGEGDRDRNASSNVNGRGNVIGSEGCRIHGPSASSLPSVSTMQEVESKLSAFEVSQNQWPELYRAIEGVRYISEHVRYEEDETQVKEDWKYVAMVLDRLFLWIFMLACVVGTCGIILQAPALYDERMPIDVELSELATPITHLK
uniref:Uncharacterized protein n=1 Tax=Strigamia maritima TaxID=126957 RepID=T1JG18_STRMM